MGAQQGMGSRDGNETDRSLQGLDSPWDGCMLIAVKDMLRIWCL